MLLRGAAPKRCKTTGMIYVVIIGALIFSVFISVTGLAEQVVELVRGLAGGHAGRDHRHGAPAAAARLGARRPGADAADHADPAADRHRARPVARSGSASSSCARWRSASSIRRSASTSTSSRASPRTSRWRSIFKGVTALPGGRLPAPGAADRCSRRWRCGCRSGSRDERRSTVAWSAILADPLRRARAAAPARAIGYVGIEVP